MTEIQIGEHLRNARKSRGLKQNDFLGEIGISQYLISAYEVNRIFPLIDSAIAIADFLDVSLEECFKGGDSDYVIKPLTHRYIAHQMRQNRENKGIKACWLAKQMGVNVNTVYCMETGASIPNLRTVIAASAALGLTIDQYIGRV